MKEKKSIEELERELAELKKKANEDKERKELEQEIWKLKHKGIRKVAGAIEKVGSGFKNATVAGVKKVGEWGNNYKNNTQAQKKQVKKVQHKQVNEYDYVDIIP